MQFDDDGNAYILSYDEGGAKQIKPMEPGVYATQGVGSFKQRLWHLLLGDAHSHVFVSTGDGDFRHATIGSSDPTAVGAELTYKQNLQLREMAGRKLLKAAVDVNPVAVRHRSNEIAAAGAKYGVTANNYICTTFASSVTGGQVVGLMPGQMIYNSMGYRPGYHYYSYSVHKSSR